MNAEVEYNPKTSEWDPQLGSNGGGRGTSTARRERAEAHKKHMASLSKDEEKYYAEMETYYLSLQEKNLDF